MRKLVRVKNLIEDLEDEGASVDDIFVDPDDIVELEEDEAEED